MIIANGSNTNWLNNKNIQDSEAIQGGEKGDILNIKKNINLRVIIMTQNGGEQSLKKIKLKAYFTALNKEWFSNNQNTTLYALSKMNQ